MNWKKLVLWLPAVLVLAILSLTVGTLLLLKASPRARQVVLTKVSRRIYQSIARQVAIGDFRLRLTNFGLEFFDIVVYGPEARSSLPLVHIQHVTVDIQLASALRRRLYLRKLLIDRPVVHISTNPSSESNPPSPKPSLGRSVETIVDLAVEECVIKDGAIYFNDTKAELAAEVHNLQLRAEFNPEHDSYHGVLHYSPGKLHYGDYPPVLHGLDTTFVLTPRNFILEKLAITGGQSRIIAHGSLDNFDSPQAAAVYEAQFSAKDLARILQSGSLTAGTVQVTGSFTYDSQANESFLQNTVLAGAVSSSGLMFRLPAGTTEVRGVKAAYKLANGNLEVQDIGAQALGGSLKASLAIHDVRGASHSALKAHLREISLEQLEPMTQQFWEPKAHLSGRISADAAATWDHTFANLVVQTDVSLKGAIGQSTLTGAVHSHYVAGREMELRESYIRTPETSLTMLGKVGSHSELEIALHSRELHELELLVASITTTLTGNPPRKLDLYGSGSLTGSVSGSLTEPRLQGKLELLNPRIAGTSWRILRSDIDLDPSEFRLRNAALEAHTKGKINFNLYTGLDHWVYNPAKPIHLEISASQIAVADVLRLADLPYPLSGALSGKASFTGSGLHPLGRGEFSLADGKIYSEPIENLNLGFQADEKTVHSSLVVHLLAGTARAELSLDPETSAYEANVQSDNIRLERLHTLQQLKLPIRGAVSLSASGRGTIASPEAKATLKLSELQFEQQGITDLTFEASVHNRRAKMVLNSASAQMPVNGHASVEIKPPYVADFEFDTSHFSLVPVLALYAPVPSGLRAETGIHASLRGALQNAKQLEGYANIEGLIVSYHEFRLDAANPIRMGYHNGILVLEPTSIKGTGIDLRAEGAAPLSDLSKAEYLLHGNVDLRIAQMIQPDLTSTGQIQFDVDSRKHGPGSDSYGEVRLVSAGLHTPAFPLGLDQTNGVLSVGRRRIEIKSFEGQSGGGTVSLRGGLTFGPSLHVDLGLTGKSIRLRYPEGVRAILDSDLTLAGDEQEAKLSGTVEVQRLSLTPDFDLDNLIRQFNDRELSASPSEFAQDVRLDLSLESASEIDVVGTQVSLHGNANLRVAGTLAEPVILGRANLVAGDLFLGGNRYVIQNGAIDFVNPLRTEPLLNVRAQTKINQYLINLNVEGPADRLNITFTSEPPLAPSDIINLLAFGNTSEVNSGNPLTTGAMGAQSALVQGLGNAISNRVQRFAGLSYFSVNPALGSSDQNTGARVIAQHRVTSNLVVTYSADVTSTQDQAVQLEYNFNKRWSVSGVRDQNGGLGATLSFRKIF
jgi:translocation and assembly module TamB